MKKLNIGIFKVLSLAVGLAVGLVLIAKISFESSYDKFYPDWQDIYCITSEYTKANEEGTSQYSQTPGAVAYYFGQEIPQIMYGTRATPIVYDDQSNVYTQDNHKLTIHTPVVLIDTNHFKVFPRPILTGDPVNVLSNWNRAMISRSFAEMLGGVEKAVGQLIFLESYPTIPIEVGGVFEDIPENSSFRFDIGVSLDAMDEMMRMMGSDFRSTMNWVGNDRYISRVKLYPGTDPASLEDALTAVEDKYLPLEDLKSAGVDIHYTLSPLTAEHSSSPGTKRTNLILGVVAAALILASVLNYIMIVISSLLGRAKGLAVRRCYGAGNGSIMGIVFKETLINLAVSLVLAVLLILALRNPIEYVLTTSLGALFSPQSLWVLALTVAVVLLIAAWIPGRAFQSIPIAVAFRNYVDNKKIWKRTLLFLQIVLASLLISLLSLIAMQYNRWVNDDPGFDYDRLVGCPMSGVPYSTRNALLQSVSSVPGVEIAGTADETMLFGCSGNNVYMPGESEELFNVGDLYSANANWSKLFGIDIVEGRNFSTPKEVMVDENFAKRLSELRGWTDGVIGKQILMSEHSESGDDVFTIVGVFEDVRVGTVVYEDTRPNILFYNENPCEYLIIKVSSMTPEVLSGIQSALDSVEPDRYELMTYTSAIYDAYQPARTIRESILAAGVVTVLIALFGLIGYTADETGRRRKEVALRKINGAQSGQIIGIFIRDIGRLAVIAVIVGCVGSYFVFDLLLQSFEVKATAPVWLFIAVAIALLAVLAAVVIARCYDIARSNPADSLRAE